MLKLFFNSHIHIGIGSTEVMVRYQQRTRSLYSSKPVIKNSSDKASHWDAQLQTLLSNSSIRNRVCHVYLSDDFARYFSVTPAKNALSLQHCRDAASARFQTLFGDNYEDWIIQGDWNLSDPFFACAIPKSLFTRLNRIATELNLCILNATPQLVLIWNRYRKQLSPDDWLLLIDENRLKIVCVKHHGIGEIRTIPFSEVQKNQRNWLEQQIRIESLRLNVNQVKRLFLFGSLPPSWAEITTDIIDLNSKNQTRQGHPVLQQLISCGHVL